jgi:hypothetical protein
MTRFIAVMQETPLPQPDSVSRKQEGIPESPILCLAIGKPIYLAFYKTLLLANCGLEAEIIPQLLHI